VFVSISGSLHDTSSGDSKNPPRIVERRLEAGPAGLRSSRISYVSHERWRLFLHRLPRMEQNFLF
jgi:hypothetical protein